MNKGYAFGFLIVLLVLILGCYVAYTGFVSARETLRAQPVQAVSTGMAQTSSGTIRVTPAVTATLVLTATTAPQVTGELTATLVVMPAVALTDTPVPANPPAVEPTEPPAPVPTQPPPTQPANTPSPGEAPPTPIAAPARQFRLAGPPAADPEYPNCCYVFGTVRDAAGNGLEGVQVQASNEWIAPVYGLTKSGAEAGKYDIPINPQAGAAWDVVVVDPGGNQISSKVRIEFDTNAASGFLVNWQRTY